jgi:4a-hydroxytetrahydrobiopterin dehydratase
MNSLLKKRCVPCEGGVKPLDAGQVSLLSAEVPQWQVVEGKKLLRQFRFNDFQAALAFVNRAGAIAESEGHHPDLNLHDYRLVDVTLWTHMIGGLHENDFILAAKIDAI